MLGGVLVGWGWEPQISRMGTDGACGERGEGSGKWEVGMAGSENDLYGGGVLGGELVGWGDCLLGGASTEPRDPGLVRRAGRAHSVRPESCDSPSSPEPSASLFGGDDCLLGGASTEPRDPGLGRRETWRVESLSGAGPAGWLRESGTRFPQSKACGWEGGDLRFERGLVRRGGEGELPA